MPPVESKLVSFRAQAVAVVTAGLLLALPAASAWAKGSEFEPDLPAYEQGKTASLHVVYQRGSYDGTLADGPFYGYLVRYPRWFAPGPIPAYAKPLGPVRMRPNPGRRCCFLASMEFVVPSVPDGTYAIQYCNDPCTVSGVGDLEPSPFWIGTSARALRIDALRSDLLDARERVTDTRHRLHRRIDRFLARRRVLAARLEVLEMASAAMNQPPLPSEEGAFGRTVVVMMSSAAGMGLLLLTLQRSRRRSGTRFDPWQ